MQAQAKEGWTESHINSIMSAFYYFRVIRAIYVEPAGNLPAFMGHPLGVALSAGSALALILMLILASPLNTLTRRYAKLQSAPTSSAAALTTANAAR